MVQVRADFRADLVALAKREFSAIWGAGVQQISDGEILMRYLDSLRRRPAIRPRRLLVADDFVCPPAEEPGWQLLQRKILNGNDLAPHLSCGHIDFENRDGLLNEWGVHHLHLGTTPSTGHPAFVERTSGVLLARITPDTFYAINIRPHGWWESSTIIESLHRNWPDSIRRYRVSGVPGEPLSDRQRRSVRKLNAQAPTAVADGTVYGPIDGGVMSAGVSRDALRASDMLETDVKNLQISIQEQFDNFIPQLTAAGYKDEPEVRAVLAGVTPEGFEVHFPDYGRRFNVALKGGWFHGIQT